MPIVTDYDEMGHSHQVLLRYNPLDYRVPPGTISDLRREWERFPVAALLAEGREGPLGGLFEVERFRRDGKDWLLMFTGNNAEWGLELEIRPDKLGEVREVLPEESYRRRLELARGVKDLVVEPGGPDPRYKEIIHPDGRREYFRAGYDPKMFTAPDEVIARIRREAKGRGSNAFIGQVVGPFRNHGSLGTTEREGKRWIRMSGGEGLIEYLIDVERSDNPDFEIRRVPPEEAWRYSRAQDNFRYPGLRVEGED